MPTISLSARFPEGTIWTKMEAETPQEVLERLNKDYPALQLTMESVIEWEVLEQNKTLNNEGDKINT